MKLPGIQKKADGELLVREHWIVAFFCNVPFHEMADGCRVVFEKWQATIPAGVMQYSIIGADATDVKPVGPKTVSRCLDQLNPKAARKREISHFAIGGPQEFSPDHWMNVMGYRDLNLDDAPAIENLVEIRFPPNFIEQKGIQFLADFTSEVALLLPFSSGYVSPALSCIAESHTTSCAKSIWPAALRYAGFDVHNNEESCFAISGKVVGARWITFLSPNFVDQLGGSAKIAKALSGFDLKPLNNGLAIRAGNEPEMGDVNKKIDTPLLRKLAKVLEPITIFGNPEIEDLLGGEENLHAWERRFFT
jgi:hypothetical protein